MASKYLRKIRDPFLLALLESIVTSGDGYKYSHPFQDKPGTTRKLYYFSAREGAMYDYSVWVGLQYYMLRYLTRSVSVQEIAYLAMYLSERGYFGDPEIFPKDLFLKLAHTSGGGLPILIKALPEGTLVPAGVPMFTVENSHDDFWWLPGFLETLLEKCWYPVTVATRAHIMLSIIRDALIEAGDTADLAMLQFLLHDFGARGASSVESEGIGGMAATFITKGTDTVRCLPFADIFYDCLIAGHSVPAAEHSTVTPWGLTREQEGLCWTHIANLFQRTPVSIVSDSRDIRRAVSVIWGGDLRTLVEGRNSGCPIVIRPDSGKIEEIVVDLLQRLYEKFGGTANSKGKIVLPPYIRVIQGDGVDEHSLRKTLRAIIDAGFSPINVIWGCGGYLLQRLDRDTQRMAYKCCAALINGEWVDVFKDPITDTSKKSWAGRPKVVNIDGVLTTKREDEPGEDLLIPVFDGDVLVEWTHDQVSQRASVMNNVAV